jgi:hypothetical protein
MFLSPVVPQSSKTVSKTFYMKDYKKVTFADLRRSYEYFLEFPKETTYPLNSRILLKIDLAYFTGEFDLNLFSKKIVVLKEFTYLQQLSLYYIFLMDRFEMFQSEFVELLFTNVFGDGCDVVDCDDDDDHQIHHLLQ